MKTNIIKIFLCLLVIAVTGCKSVQVNSHHSAREKLIQEEQWRSQLPLGEQPAVTPVFPKALTYVLKNGLSVYVVEDHRLPIAQVRLVFKNGSAQDPIGQSGLQNLTTLMLKEGTKELSSLGLAEAFAQLGTEVNVGVTKDFSQVSVNVLSNKIDDAVKLMAAMVQEPRMEKADFDRVTSQLEGALTSDEGVPSYVAQVSFLMAAYGPQHPYAYPSKGTLKSLSLLDLARVKAAHHQNFGPNNAALIIVGDAKLADVKKLAKSIFGSWKKINYHPAKIAAPLAKKQMETHLVSRPHTPQTYVLVGQPVATAQDKDLAALEVFQGILVGLPSSRLDGNLRERKGWTYGVGSMINPLRGLGPMMISTSIQVPFGADALGELLKEFELLKKEPVSDEELKAAREGLLHSFASRYATVEKIGGNIANRFVYDLPSDNEEKYYNKIQAVSKEDIMAIAKRVFNSEKMVAVAVGELEVMQVPLGTMNVGKVIVDKEERAEEKPSK